MNDDPTSLRKTIAAMQAKADKQRHEIARLTAACEALRAEKSNLNFDLHMARARCNQLHDRLVMALPYVEEAAADPAHNPGPVKALAERIREVVAP